MSSRYTSNGKRRSSMTHARRSWTCPCGKTVWGNGGKSGHRRVCPTWREEEIAIHRSLIKTLQQDYDMRHSVVIREAIERHEAKLAALLE